MEDARIYTVQTGTLEADGGKITVGVRLPADAAVPSGLQSTRVEAADFAVFRAAEPPTEQLAASWARIALSSIEPSHDAVVEAWEFNADGSAVVGIDLWVPVGIASKAAAEQASETAEEAPVVAVEVDEAPAATTATVDDEPMQERASLPTKQHEAFHVVGFQTTANPEDNKEIAKAVQGLWDRFAKSNINRDIQDIEEPQNVYVSYTDYQQGSVTITLGYRTKSPNNFSEGKDLNSASIAANSYFTTAMRSGTTYYDKQAWQRLTNAVTTRSANSADFEVYTFSSNYEEVVESYLWVAAK